ncbi:MAG: epoxyqueuosine reductase QueH [Candidatus Ratteibacteria bacterium]|nr:epoxyqueuosine reductase QueH [Candidatus Ratteibacteria bacterium]
MIKPKMLLHICCAPCAIPVIKILEKRDFLITGFWYNPNIWPEKEYEERREALRQYKEKKDMAIIYDDCWAPRSDSNFSSERRCPGCYEERLTRTVQTAERLSFDFFTTTLLVSPYQKHFAIRDLAEDIGLQFGVNFYYEDFRPFFYRYKKEASELGLYHQRYCGCKASIKEAEETRKKQRAKRKAASYS